MPICISQLLNDWMKRPFLTRQCVTTLVTAAVKEQENEWYCVAYHASHEQFSPSALLRYARLAEQAGFTAVSSSEYLQPWSPRQGQSGFAWAWMGAAMQATSLPFSVVCAPGPRYHPMILAQAAATLAELCPGRFHMALGSGEALNERVTGELWPSKPERTVGGAPEDVRQKVDAFYEGGGLASR